MDKFEDQLDEIRMKLYEETANMPKNEAIKFVNDNARKIALKYGIKLIKEPNFMNTNKQQCKMTLLQRF